jgi:mRNA interferase MazF
MKKEFIKWSKLKECLHNQENTKEMYFREREIWWCHLGCNIGYEQDGKHEKFLRPVVILKKFNQYVFWAIPLSTVLKDNPYYIQCESQDLGKRSAIISQLKLISSKRLIDKISVVEIDSFEVIKKAIKDLI